MGKVYKIQNNVNGKIYIGITTQPINERFDGHIKSSDKGSPFRLHCAIRKYGKDNFTIIEIDSSESRTELAALERKWIQELNSYDPSNGYNMTLGGDGAAGRDIKESTKQKLSDSVSKHRASLTDEERKRLTSAANNAKIGKSESNDSRKLKSQSQKNRFSKMSESELKLHGERSKNGISADGKIKQVNALTKSFSPRRQKGFKDELTICPHCGKIGGSGAMKRYHFDRCKLK